MASLVRRADPARDVSAPLDIEDLRLAVYRAFSIDGRVPDAEGLAAALGVDAASSCAPGCTSSRRRDTSCWTAPTWS